MEHWADYLIFALFMCISLGIGLYFAFTGGKQRTTSEFIMANRNLKVLPTMMSLVVSFISAISVIGMPAEVFKYGVLKALLMFMVIAFGMTTFAQLIVPWLYPLKLTSVYEYFIMRYPDCRGVSFFTTALGLIKNVTYMGTAIYAPAIALEAASGWPLSWNIVMMTVVCTAYSAVGGMKAVIWTDVFQAIVLLVGLIVVLAKGWMMIGSFQRALHLLDEHGRLTLYNFDPDPRTRITFWNYLTSAFFNHWSMCFAQASVQRFSAVGSLSGAKLTLLTAIPLKIAFVLLSTLCGILTFAYFADSRCDPMVSGEITKSNQIMSYFVKKAFKDHPGFSGLFMATLASGALSTVSSALSGCSAIAYKHFVRPLRPNMSELFAATISKCLVVLFGILTLGIAFAVAEVHGPIYQVNMMFFSAAGGPLVGLFLLGGVRLFRAAKGLDVLIGAIFGFGFNLWIIFGAMQMKGIWPPLPPIPSDNCTPPLNITDIPVAEPLVVTGIKNIHTISFIWYTLTGMLATVIPTMLIAFTAKCVGKRKSVFIPERLFINFRNMYKFVPITCNPDVDKKKEGVRAIETSTYL